jgi:hypothetical protein
MRWSGKYGKIVVSTTQTAVTSEEATLNNSPVSIGGKSYAAYQVASLANKLVVPDSAETPITVTLAKGTGSDIPPEISWVVDCIAGRIIFSQALSNGNTVTVDYTYASGLVEVGDMTEWTIDEKVKELDITAFNDEWEVFTALQKSWDASITGHLNTILWDKAVGNSDDATVNVSAGFVYAKFYLSRKSVSTNNPYWVGAGLLSASIKTPYAGKIEISGKIKGSGGLAKITA